MIDDKLLCLLLECTLLQSAFTQLHAWKELWHTFKNLNLKSESLS